MVLATQEEEEEEENQQMCYMVSLDWLCD